MRALIWKECREFQLKLALGFGAAILLELLRSNPTMERQIVEMLFERNTYSLLGMFISLLVGMDLISSERSRGTLGFTLAHPVPVSAVVVTKFLVGAVGLTIIHGSMIGIFYLDPLAGVLRDAPTARLFTEIGFLRMMLYILPPLLGSFAIVLFWSALTDRPLIALAASVLTTFPVGWAVNLIGSDIVLFSFFGHRGYALRLAHSLVPFAGRFTFWALLSCGFGALCWYYLRHRRTDSVGWRVLVGTATIVAVLGFVSGSEGMRIWESPDRSLSYERPLWSLDIIGNLGYATTDHGLVVFDFSGQGNPQEVGSISVPDLRTHHLALVGESAGVLTYRPRKDRGADMGIILFDVGNPQDIRETGRATLFEKEEFHWSGPIYSHDDLLYIPVATNLGLEILTVRPSVGAEIHSRTRVTTWPDSTMPRREYWYRRNDKMDLAFTEDAIYAGHGGHLSVIDRSADTLVVIRTIDLDRTQFSDETKVTTDGNHLYVSRTFPRELVIFDLADPLNPKESGYALLRDTPSSMGMVDDRIRVRGRGFQSHGKITEFQKMKDGAVRQVTQTRAAFAEPERSIRGHIRYTDGLFYRFTDATGIVHSTVPDNRKPE